MSQCRFCHGSILHTRDFGPLPLCNRFVTDKNEIEFTHPLSMGVCGGCGVVQLTHVPSADDVRPRVDWITYNEPEGHLDKLVDDLIPLAKLNSSSVVGGLTFKDDSTLRRLSEKGIVKQWRCDPRELSINDSFSGLETIQQALVPHVARTIVEKHGHCDLFFARHIFEHVHRPDIFLKSLRLFLKPGGRLVLEIPDCERALEKNDYSTAWEEHVFYFTQTTFVQTLTSAGLAVDYFASFPYSLENSLVAVVKFTDGTTPAPKPSIGAEVVRFRKFSDNFETQRNAFRRQLESCRASYGPLAVLGAGHLSMMFINLFGLSDLFQFVVDDNPHKKGLHMPGSKLPIVGSAELIKHGIKLCLMGVSPESEKNVMKNQAAYLSAGGKFASFFPDSAYALNRIR